MVNIICPKCNMKFNKTSNFKRHLNKKIDCSLKENNIIVNIELFENEKNICRNLQKICRTQKMEPKIELENLEHNNILLNTIEKDDIEFNCSYCLKKYSSKGTLTRHLKDNCKIKKQKENEKENIFKLLLNKDKQKDNEIKELKQQNKLLIKKINSLINLKEQEQTKIINNVNCNNITNNQNNFIFNFGKEDLSVIDRKIFLDRVVKNYKLYGVRIPEEILKIIHFNPDYPQLSNIYISDINREKCMIFEDKEWKLSSIDKIPEVIEKVILFSNDVELELKSKYPNNKKLYERLDVIKKYNNMNDEEYIEELKENFEDNKELIKRCRDFKKLTYDTFKTTLYNEGKKIKKK